MSCSRVKECWYGTHKKKVKIIGVPNGTPFHTCNLIMQLSCTNDVLLFIYAKQSNWHESKASITICNSGTCVNKPRCFQIQCGYLKRAGCLVGQLYRRNGFPAYDWCGGGLPGLAGKIFFKYIARNLARCAAAVPKRTWLYPEPYACSKMHSCNTTGLMLWTHYCKLLCILYKIAVSRNKMRLVHSSYLGI